MKIDLHVHSTFSDGIYAPSALVELAANRDVTVLSIADHDCVDGIAEAKSAAKNRGMEVIPGVELSSEFHGRDLHILGYGFDIGNAELKEMLQRFRNTRHSRGLKIVENLKEMGVQIDPEDVLARSTDGSLGRPHIAEALIENGYASSHAEAFARFLGEHCAAYVKKHKLTPTQAINYIRSSGGLAFIAHPGYYLENGIHELVSCGFDGIEIIHPNHSEQDVTQLRIIADKYGLLMSGGSDYHGFSGRDQGIGDIELPRELWEKLKKELERNN